jgi:hypothetical protein
MGISIKETLTRKGNHVILAKFRRRHAPLPTTYEIKVAGRLDGAWSHALYDMRISTSQDGVGNVVTTLCGQVADQSMLAVVLDFVRELGYPVLRIRRM